jgi:hypothetical protein
MYRKVRLQVMRMELVMPRTRSRVSRKVATTAEGTAAADRAASKAIPGDERSDATTAGGGGQGTQVPPSAAEKVDDDARSKKRGNGREPYQFFMIVAGALAAAWAVERVWGRKFGQITEVVDVTRPTFGGLLALAAVILLVVGLTGLQLLGSFVWTFIVLAYGGVAWLLLGGASEGLISNEARAVTFGLVSVGLLLIAAGIMFENETVPSSLSPKTATASTVLMLWTVVIVYAVAYVAASAFLTGHPVTCSSNAARDCIRQSAWPDYLILLGVPGAAAAYAKSRSVSEKLSEPDVATTEVTSVQYLVFNVLGMLFVAGGLWQFGRLDDVPDVLLGLSGASALTYALVKPETATGQDAQPANAAQTRP